MQSWSIIIFGFNEEKNIGDVVVSAYEVLKKISNTSGEIIVVDDGSTDNSRSVLNGLQESIPCLKTIFHRANLGIGAALRSGYSTAICENICAIPADGQFNITQLLDWSTIEENSIVAFYRKKNEIYSPFRKILSWCNRQILFRVFNVEVRDINWVKIYKRVNLLSITFELNSSLIESEIFIKLIRSNVRLIETPTVYLPRHFGKPKGASVKIMTKAILELPDLYFATHRFLKNKKDIS